MNQRNHKLLFLTLPFFLLAGCQKPFQSAWQEESGYRWAELPVASGMHTGFRELPPARTGIGFMNNLTEDQIISNQHFLDGSGVALGDIDNDGWCDIYFCCLDGSNILYRNKGNWEFEDITAAAGVGLADRFSKGAVLADVDGDGDLDLLVTVLDGPNAYFQNDGKGNFTDISVQAGFSSLPDRTGNTTMALADIEGDGDLDLYMVCYKFKARRDREIPIFTESGMMLYEPDFGERDILYINDGQGNFKDVPLDSDVFMQEEGLPVIMPRAWGLTARLQDMNGDGAPDIYVCNDFASPDIMWINDGKGKFRAVPHHAIRTTSMSSMAVDFSDIDRDGDLDFFISDMMSREYQRRKMQQGADPRTHVSVGEILNRPQIARNTLFMNRGDHTYAEIANYAGVESSEWTWSAIFMDVDLDGYEDLLITTGHAYDVLDFDTQERIIRKGVRNVEELRRTIFMYPRLETPNFIFRNQGDLTFQDKSREWGFSAAGISHGMAVGDLDNDGDLDVVMNNYQQPAGIFRNESRAPRVAVRLRGSSPNTQGIGAVIKLTGGPVIQSKEMICGGQYLSDSQDLIVFAAPLSPLPLNLEVTWRSGKRSVIENVKANRMYEIDESAAVDLEPLPGDTHSAYFQDVSQLLDHSHFEEPFNDFYRQPLSPRQFSQLGPGLAWYDIDGDLDDDLIISNGRGRPLSIFANDGKRGFSEWSGNRIGEGSGEDQTAIVAYETPTGKAAILIGLSAYENQSKRNPAVLHYTWAGNSWEEGMDFPFHISSTGPLAMADYDRDGDLDLLVGGNIVAGRYPAPASSKMYRQVDGVFSLDTLNSPLLTEVGLVSSAIFSDLDNDGDPDLILAIQWGPVRILLNEGGRFRDATRELGMANRQGWWNGVTTGDLNGDGRLDIIATNWGLNSSYRYSEKHPLKIYYKDFDNNGSLDLIESCFDPLLNKYVPLRGFTFLSRAIPAIRSRVTSHRQYGELGVTEIFTPSLDQTDSLWANTLAHTLFLNIGNGFEARTLPAEAQFAPAFYAGVADFDGDGCEDIFLAQNFFAMQPEIPRLDGGRGLWLRGDGQGGLSPVPGQESGIEVYGEQRGAALGDYDRDGRIDLVVSQNGAQTRLYRNQKGIPGLRIRLQGPPGNRQGVGAQIRLKSERGFSPVKEIHAGSGYWSLDSPVLIFSLSETPLQVVVNWPGGKVTETDIPSAVKEMSINGRGEVVSRIP